MLLYGVSTFFPQQLGTIYQASAIMTAVYLLPYELVLCFAGFGGGLLVTRIRKFRWLLVSLLSLLAIFCGLQAINTPDSLATCVGLGAGVGLGSALLLVVPVAGVATSVPSHLIGTSLTLLSCARGIGGVIGITIFASVYGDKIGTYLPVYVGAAAENAGLPASALPAVFAALLGHDDAALATIPGMSPAIEATIQAAFVEAASESYKYVWLGIMAVTLAGVIAAYFLEEITDKMTNFVESALENNEIRNEQQHKA